MRREDRRVLGVALFLVLVALCVLRGGGSRVLAQAAPRAPGPPLIQYWGSDMNAIIGQLHSNLASLALNSNPSLPGACPGGMPGCPSPGVPSTWGLPGGAFTNQNYVAHDQLRGYIYSVTGVPGVTPSYGIHVSFAGGAGFTSAPVSGAVPTSVAIVPTPPPPYPSLPCGATTGDSFAVAENSPNGPGQLTRINVYHYPGPPPSACLSHLSTFNLSAILGFAGARIEHIYGNTTGLVGGIVVDAAGTSWVFTVNFAVTPAVIGTLPTFLHGATSGLANEGIVWDPVNAMWWITASRNGTSGPWHTQGALWAWAPGQFLQQISLPNVTGGVALAPDPNLPFPLVGGPCGQCRRAVFLLEQVYVPGPFPTGGMILHRIGWNPNQPPQTAATLDWSSPTINLTVPPQASQGYVYGPIGVDRDGNVLCGGFDTQVQNLPVCGPQSWGPVVSMVDRCGTWLGSLVCIPWTSPFTLPFCPLRFSKGDGALGWRIQRGYTVP